jgi:hypothetical protein
MQSMLRAALFAALSLVATQARADIVFCNKFPHEIFVAIAYPQVSGQWLSRGWMSIAPRDCAYFDSAIRVKTFYYRAESDPYRERGHRVKEVWGKSNRSFAIWENSNFEYWDASRRVLNSSLAPFTAGPVLQSKDPNAGVSAKVTFNADGTSTVEIK